MKQRRKYNSKNIPSYNWLLLTVISLILNNNSHSQILFAEDCFVGGVTVAGVNRDGGAGMDNKCLIKWENNYELYKAYVVAYRYGRPEPHSTFVNGREINWNDGNQAGPEHTEENNFSDYFAPHAIEITEGLLIENDTLTLDFPEQTFYDHSWNWGWCSMYVVILYKSPDITTSICNQLYITDQKQDLGQQYVFESPLYQVSLPVILSLFTSRISDFEADATSVVLNSNTPWEIWGNDIVIPPHSGAQGSFFYEGNEANGLNGDTLNNSMHHHDATSVINEYLTSGAQALGMYRNDGGSSNLHPAFTLTYTPECPITEVSIPRSYRYCRGDSVQLQASGYDHYAWSMAEGLSDSTAANPICTADSSQWYQVRLWNDDGCSQTIPVHVEVTDISRPESLVVTPTVCPQFTGTVVAEHVPGATPMVFSLNGQNQNHGSFTGLEAGEHDLTIVTADGCQWDTTVVINMNVIHHAAFEANPETGFTPLDVFFENKSSPGSTAYNWLVDGVYITEEDDLYETFTEAGIYHIELIAYRGEAFCADTASFTLLVEEGLTMVIPNIITPNGDGMNDALMAQSSGVANAQWQVFNRWGNMLHSSEAFLPDNPIMLWAPEKGQYPAGVYTIVVVAVGNNGRQMSRTVMVTLAE